MNKIIDIPSPINLKNPQHATQWAHEANTKHPYRVEFFKHYSSQILNHPEPKVRILELGSGPGYFAYELLKTRPDLHYTAVDFSAAMHTLAQQRLTHIPHTAVDFILADLKQQNWYRQLNTQRFDFVVIHQALHELRHKAYACDFHKSIAEYVIQPNGTYFITDHLATPDGHMSNAALYMSKEEHRLSLKNAGFQHVQAVLEIDGLCAFQANLS